MALINPQLVPTRVHEDGTQSVEYTSTPNEDRQGIEIRLYPNRVIPVVFLPGIMGTHLKLSEERQQELKKKTNVAWRPEDTAEAIAMIFKDPAQRQSILDPEATEVDRYEPQSDPNANRRHRNVSSIAFVSGPPAEGTLDERARLRGWSEVYFDSYGKMLQALESTLNAMCDAGQPQTAWTDGAWRTLDMETKAWGGDGGAPLEKEQLLKICDAWYPVHAVGYNWLRSNGDSGKYVAGRIQEIIEQYKAMKFNCQKVIVVTHSMGGLVARALIHPDHGAAQDLVAGIVHGAMPAVGAAAAYKRMRFGFEGSGIAGYVAKKVLGDTGPRVTAVLANAPAGLQLLPTERYGPAWLKVQLDGQELLSLPQSDPTTEIYTLQNEWYRLINPEWVNPAGSESSSIDSTNVSLLNARKFHRDIGTTYHPITYLSYGADEKQKAWGEVVWRAGKAPFFSGGFGQHLGLEKLGVSPNTAAWQTRRDTGDDDVVILTDGMDQQPFGARIDEPGTPGDGTVPAERSAQDPVRQGKTRVSFEQTGFEHQSSYLDAAVIASTIYGIAHIAHDAFDWWEG